MLRWLQHKIRQHVASGIRHLQKSSKPPPLQRLRFECFRLHCTAPGSVCTSTPSSRCVFQTCCLREGHTCVAQRKCLECFVCMHGSLQPTASSTAQISETCYLRAPQIWATTSLASPSFRMLVRHRSQLVMPTCALRRRRRSLPETTFAQAAFVGSRRATTKATLTRRIPPVCVLPCAARRLTQSTP